MQGALKGSYCFRAHMGVFNLSFNCELHHNALEVWILIGQRVRKGSAAANMLLSSGCYYLKTRQKENVLK